MRTINVSTALLVLLLAIPLPSTSQIRVVSTRALSLTDGKMWGYPRFGPTGSRIYFTTQSYDGIWEHSPDNGETRLITSDPGSGYGFSVSNDGRKIAYRKTVRGERPADKRQEIITIGLDDSSTAVLGAGKALSVPAAVDKSFAFLSGQDLLPAPPKGVGAVVLGIIDTKICLIRNGSHITLDPLKDGSYIWPSLSPGGGRLAAYDMGRGAFIYDLRTESVTRLGKADGPVWTRDTEWIVAFSEQNDGYRITGSDLIAVSSDGKQRVTLTPTPDRIELFPSCSPVENKIVCHTLDGSILLLTYSVDK